jgi:hypothetical protein
MFLTSTLAGGEWSASRPCLFTTRERAPGTHWIGGWVDPIVGLNDVEKRKLLTLPRLELRPLVRSVRSQSLYRLRHPGSDNSICKSKKSIHFDNSLMTYIFVNHLLMIFADRNVYWDVNKITRILNILLLVYNLCVDRSQLYHYYNHWCYWNRYRDWLGLVDRGIGVLVPVGSRILFSPCRPDRLWGPPKLLCIGYRELFTWG